MASDSYSAVRSNLAATAERFAALLAAVPDPTKRAIGDWSIAECATHVGALARLDLASATTQMPDDLLEVAGRALTARVDDVAGMNALAIEQRTERDLRVIGSEIVRNVQELLEETGPATGSEGVMWLGGLMVPRSAVVAHLLFEFLVHGRDIARGAGLSWRVPREAALAAYEGFILALLSSEGLAHFVGASDHADVSIVAEFRIRGSEPVLVVCEGGTVSLAAPASRPVDTYLNADAGAFLLVLFGRMSKTSAVLRGKMIAWGTKPWKLFELMRVLKMP